MDAVQAYYNGSVFVPLVPVNAELNQPAIITILEVAKTDTEENRIDNFFGALSSDDYAEITEALKDTERILQNCSC
jgi:ribosomal protein L12E/L44/L45/RPP1/RPP2